MGRAKKATHVSRDFRFHRPALYPNPHKTASGYIILAGCAFLESPEKPFVKTRTRYSANCRARNRPRKFEMRTPGPKGTKTGYNRV